MKKITLFFFLASFFNHFNCIFTRNAFTNEKWTGRLGDHLLWYAKRKIIEQDYGLILYEQPFEHSDKFVLHTAEKRLTPEIVSQFEKEVLINNRRNKITNNTKQRTLFRCFWNKFFPRTESPFQRMKRDPKYAKEIKKMIAPAIPIEWIKLPEDKISVAVHVRKPSGRDSELSSIQEYSSYPVSYNHQVTRKIPNDQSLPGKFPPDQYYIDQIKKLSEILDAQPMYVYIFTDDKNPEELCKNYQKKINNPNITFDCSKDKNYASHVVNDFFNMTQFDCLIRGQSHFSTCAQLIGHHKIVIYAQHLKWVGNRLIVDKVGILERK